MMIQILGTGCAKCQELEKLVKAVVAETGTAATVEKVTDLKQIAAMGVFATPAVVIDGVVKSVGGIPPKTDILSWIA